MTSECTVQTRVRTITATEFTSEDDAHVSCSRRLSNKIWKENLPHLKQFSDPRPLFQHLVMQDLLTHDEQVEFHDQPHFIHQRDLILHAVPNSAHDDYLDRFVSCLRDCSDDNRGHIDLITILTNSLANHRGKFVCSMEETATISVVAHGKTSELDTMVQGNQSGLDQFQRLDSKTTTEGFFRKCCTKRWIACYSFITLPIIIGVIVIATLSQAPSVNDIRITPNYVHQITTAGIDFGIATKWIESFSLSITSCTARVLVVEGSPCDQLPINSVVVPSSESLFRAPQFLYLLPGSEINITIRANVNVSELWIIKSFVTYRDFSNNGIGTNLFDCEIQQENVQCYRVQPEQVLPSYRVTVADYYFIIARPAPFGAFEYSYLNNSYDIRSIQEEYTTRQMIVGSSNIQNSIQISNFFDFSEKCVLLSTDCPIAAAQAVSYEDVTRRSDVLVIPGILILIVCVLYIGLVSIVHFLCMRKIIK